MKSKFRFLAVVLLLSTVLVACSNDGGAIEPEIENDLIVQETLAFALSEEATSLDPSRGTDVATFKISINLFETLFNVEERDMIIEPGLAKKWKVTDDGLTYTLTLEKDVKFHDDTDFNAEAVVKNFERWANGDAKKFPNYAIAFEGFKDEKSHLIESVTADGNDKVVIQLKRPQALFLENLAKSAFAIASPTAFEEFGDDDFEENPVGTGPFRFVEWKPSDSITLSRFEGYRKKGLPKLSKVTFIAIPDNIARLNALLAGDVDLADDIDPDNVAIIEADEYLQLFERPTLVAGSVEGDSSTLFLGGVESLIGFHPNLSGADLFSSIEFKEQEQRE